MTAPSPKACLPQQDLQNWDARFMDLALRLGRRTQGQTAENPSVGCVLVQFGPAGPVIVGTGHTQPGGRPHAERVALAQAGKRAEGATAYVTLEPCSHTGKSPPCASALIEAGIARLVCAKRDPDLRVDGRGFSMLENQRIAVETGLLEAEAKWDLRGFLSRTQTNRPWLQAKLAISPEGYIGSRDSGNVPITGPEAKAHTYALRARADAVMVGVDTVLIDDPALTVRLPGLEHSSPIRIVLDSKGRIPLSCNLVRTANEVPTWIIASGLISAEKALTLEARGCKILLTDPTSHNHVDLHQALGLLAEEGINQIFCEPGGKLSKALLEEDLVDEFVLYEGVNHLGHGVRAFEAACPQDTQKSPAQSLMDAGFFLDKQRKLGQDRAKYFQRSKLRF